MDAGLDIADSRRSPFPVAMDAVLLSKLVLLVAAAWVGLTLAARVEDGFWKFVVAVLVPLLLLGGGWLAREAWRRLADRRAIARIARGGPRKPGAWVAVAGEALAVRSSFQAPLSQRDALACRYRVMDQPHADRRGADRTRSYALRPRLEGFHLVPTVIQGRSERIRLRAFPELRNLEKSHVGPGTSSIEDSAVRGPVGPLRQGRLARLFTTPIEEVHLDWRLAHGEEVTERTTRHEWVLAPGDEVCALGRWSADGALLPHWARTAGIPVYAGKPEEAAATLGTERKVYLGLASVPFVLAGAIATWVLI